MTEIEKLFENAGVEHGSCQNYNRLEQCCNSPFCDSGMCPNGIGGEKNPFTAEKHLRLIEWFISCSWWLNLKSLDKTLDFSLDFDEKLAKLVNRLWESFDDQEKEEIRNILNE